MKKSLFQLSGLVESVNKGSMVHPQLVTRYFTIKNWFFRLVLRTLPLSCHIVLAY